MVEKNDLIEDFKDGFVNAKKILSDKKIQNIIIILLLLGFIILGTYIRVQNMPLLIDQTTGEYIPLALDPFYFLRIAETIVETNGNLPAADLMRYPSLEVPWHPEILPKAIVFLYKTAKIISPEISLRFIDVLSPVIFFILGLILFFFLIYYLTKSRWIAVLSAGFLTIIPPYLYRSMAGFADHEAIGMLGFFLAMLIYTISMNFLDKKISLNKDYLKVLGLGVLAGITTTFSIVSWAGIAKFLFMIIPLSFLIIWLMKCKKDEKNILKYLLFYVVWFIFALLGGFLFGYPITSIFFGFIVAFSSILTPFVLILVLIDYLILKYGKRFLKEKQKRFRIIYSGILALIFGGIIYQIFIGNVFGLISSIINQIISPAGKERIFLTVAENKQPYLVDWISQIGKRGFWIFVAGLLMVGINLAKGIKGKKEKIMLGFIWLIFIAGILFSSISPNSLLNGSNFISKFVMVGSLLLFGIYSIWIYFKKDFSFSTNLIIIASWLVPMVLVARSTIRIFFAIVPFACFMMIYGLFEIYKNRKLLKDDFSKFIAYLLIGLIIIGLIFAAVTFTKDIMVQAKYTGPSANYQWQHAMSWTRENTPEGSKFVHWWDYGYWVQTLGERPTITDGGHANGHWDHLIGRYLLTTPFPETAKSLMKTHDVNYLLIDQTDIGKYSAYSSIGDDAEISDRASYIPTFLADPSQTQETRYGKARIYSGGVLLDLDVIYNSEGGEIFLPKGKAVLGAIILETENETFKQPQGIYIYNNQQHRIPIRYAFIGDELFDFKKGINSTVFFFTKVDQDTTKGKVDNVGAAMYLSEKTKDSLLAKMYLMNDPLNEYPELKLVHSEQDQISTFLKYQGVQPTEIVFYQGVRGPIKIWSFNPGEDILIRKEFLEVSGGYGELDDLQFIK